MTTSKSISVREKLNNVTKCSICTETYSDSRVLPCIHTYCLKCIKNFSHNKYPGDYVSCPACRKDFVVPEHGIDSLPKNFFIEQLKVSIQSLQTHIVYCEECDVMIGRKQSTMYCIECQQKFCEVCVSEHRGIRLTQVHILLAIGDDGKAPEAAGKLLTVPCDKHLNGVAELYCFQCNELICTICFATSHQSHKCSKIDEVSEDFRSQMTDDIENMNKTAKYCRNMVKKQKKQIRRLNTDVIVIEMKICDTAERMEKIYDSENFNSVAGRTKMMIDLEKLKLVQELSTLKTDRMKEVQHVIENIEKHAHLVDSFSEYTEILRNNGTASAVAQQTRALHDRASELMKLDHIQLEVNDLGCVKVTFDAAERPTKETGQLLGTIKWQRVTGNYRIFIADCNIF
jgi:hypothetical protein